MCMLTDSILVTFFKTVTSRYKVRDAGSTKTPNIRVHDKIIIIKKCVKLLNFF